MVHCKDNNQQKKYGTAVTLLRTRSLSEIDGKIERQVEESCTKGMSSQFDRFMQGGMAKYGLVKKCQTDSYSKSATKNPKMLQLRIITIMFCPKIMLIVFDPIYIL